MSVKKMLLILAAVLTLGLGACSPNGAGTSPTIPINSMGPTLAPTSMPSSLPSTEPSTMPSNEPSGSALPSPS